MIKNGYCNIKNLKYADSAYDVYNISRTATVVKNERKIKKKVLILL